jgi:16S rRNA (guanine966-N2)-methyltransferase
LRVIAGTLKGQRLGAPKGGATRPTADRVREAVFSLLGPVDGASVLDLYAGSGAFGIEALSRGAADAAFVDADPMAVRAARANLERLGIEIASRRRPEARARVTRAGAPSFLRSAAERGHSWSLVFCDPPYRLADRLASDLGESLPPVLRAEARVVCESSYRKPLELALPLVQERRYGDTLIRLYGVSR